MADQLDDAWSFLAGAKAERDLILDQIDAEAWRLAFVARRAVEERYTLDICEPHAFPRLPEVFCALAVARMLHRLRGETTI